VERFERGALAYALSREDLDVLALRDHDSGRLLGRTSSGTLRVWESEAGLDYEIDPPDTEEGREALALARRQDLRGSSFAFVVAQGGDEWDEDDEKVVRTVKKVAQLFDVGPVVRPAYHDSVVTARSIEEACKSYALAHAEPAQDAALARERVVRLVSAGL